MAKKRDRPGLWASRWGRGWLWRWIFEARLQPVVGETDAVEGMVICLRDISHHRRQERDRLRLGTAIEQAVESDTVLADPTQIHQALMNLCTNAAHAMGQGPGTLRVFLAGASSEDAWEVAQLPLGQRCGAGTPGDYHFDRGRGS